MDSITCAPAASSHLVQANQQQYQTTANLDVRQAFNSLPKEKQTDIFLQIAKYYQESDFFHLPGKTLEVGGGNGLFWKIGRETLLDASTAMGELHITDSSSEMVAACKKVQLLQNNPKVILEEADATHLTYSDNSFTRIIANFMLYECKTEQKVQQAVKEMARVLNEQGRAILVTMDENVHMIQLYSTLQSAKDALAAEGISIKTEFPAYAPAIKAFCLGNALNVLKSHFGKITFSFEDNAILVSQQPVADSDVTGPDFVVKYLQSLAFIQAAMKGKELPDLFFEKIRQIVADEIASQGVFKITRRDVFIDCQQPVKAPKQVLLNASMKA